MVYNYQIIVFLNIISIFDYIVNYLILEKRIKYKLDYIVGEQRSNNDYIVNNNLTIFRCINNEGLIVINSYVSRFVTLLKDR